MISLSRLSAAIREIPVGLAAAQVVVHLDGDDTDWVIDSVTFSPDPEAVPGTGGQVRQPVLRIHVRTER